MRIAIALTMVLLAGGVHAQDRSIDLRRTPPKVTGHDDLKTGTCLPLGAWCKSETDVQPIQEEFGNLGHEACADSSCWWRDGSDDLMRPDIDTLYRRKRTTCADKSRFLMTAEDGTKHCIRLNTIDTHVLGH